MGQGLSCLQRDTDSLVSHWVSLSDDSGGFVPVADQPGIVPGRLFCSGDNRFTGLGSDVMADLGLIQSLENATVVREVELPEDPGPLSLFVCIVNQDRQPR
ncbi:MAG: hypothetical protein KAH54_02200 [Candidatus Sabulitectum sp.]|nr:hypothetical protein [Candidatus Sabulitectum sp.]